MTEAGSFSALPRPTSLLGANQSLGASRHTPGGFGAVLLHRADTAPGRDSRCRQLPAELDEVWPFLLYRVSSWSPGEVAGARRSQPVWGRGAMGTAAANPNSSYPSQKWQAVVGGCVPTRNSAPGMLPAGAEHHGGDPSSFRDWDGDGDGASQPSQRSPARWFSLQPLTHLPKMSALISWQETATGKW